MTAREQRRRRRELRAMRRRVAGMIVLLSILAGLVLYAASHTWTGIEKGTDPAETDPLPLATVSGIEQVAELEHASGPLMLNEAEAVVDILLGGSGE